MKLVFQHQEESTQLRGSRVWESNVIEPYVAQPADRITNYFEGIPISQDANPTRPVAVRPRVQIVAVLPLIWGTIARSLKEILKVPDL